VTTLLGHVPTTGYLPVIVRRTDRVRVPRTGTGPGPQARSGHQLSGRLQGSLRSLQPTVLRGIKAIGEDMGGSGWPDRAPVYATSRR
jgi:hypothetical protein